RRLRMSKGAAQAILGKVYVFMGEYEKALTQLNEAIDNFDSAPIEVGLYDYNITTQPGGVHAPGPFGPGSPFATDNKQSPYARQILNTFAFTNTFVLIGPETSSMYDSNDTRLNYFFTNTAFA